MSAATAIDIVAHPAAAMTMLTLKSRALARNDGETAGVSGKPGDDDCDNGPSNLADGQPESQDDLYREGNHLKNCQGCRIGALFQRGVGRSIAFVVDGQTRPRRAANAAARSTCPAANRARVERGNPVPRRPCPTSVKEGLAVDLLLDEDASIPEFSREAGEG